MVIQAFAALIFVISLIGLVAYFFSRGREKFHQKFPGGIRIKDVKAVDGKNKIISLTYENVSYVVLVGQSGMVVLDKKSDELPCLDAEIINE